MEYIAHFSVGLYTRTGVSLGRGLGRVCEGVATEHYTAYVRVHGVVDVKGNRNEMEFLFCGVVILLSSSIASVSGTILFLLSRTCHVIR